MWINFLIPKIEDGNNFGVSIQVGVNLQPFVILLLVFFHEFCYMILTLGRLLKLEQLHIYRVVLISMCSLYNFL